MQIIIHCDISHAIGLGHYTRCKLLYKTFQAYGLKSFLHLGVFGDVDLCPLEYDVLMKKKPGDIGDKYPIEPSIIVLDLLHKENLGNQKFLQYLEQLRTYGNKIVVIEGLEDEACPSEVLKKLDILITPYVTQNFCQKTSHHLFGKDYLLLERDRLLTGKYIRTKAENILLTFGGSDPYNQTTKCLEQLKKDPRAYFYTFTVVVGPLMTQQQIDHIQSYKNDLSIKIVKGSRTLVEHLKDSDVAITNTGQTRYELAASGVPMVIFPFDNEGHKKSLIFQKLGAAVINECTESFNPDIVFQLLIEASARKKMSDQGRKHFFSPDSVQNITKKIVEICQ